MLSWLAILDIGTLIIPAQLAILRKKLAFWATLVIWSVLATVLYAHFYFHISWTLLGKVVINAGIPSVMALAGNYLASAIAESPREKRLWRVLFIALAIVGVVGSFFVESAMDREHAYEMIGLQSRLEIIGKLVEKNPPQGLTKNQTLALLQAIGIRPQTQMPTESQNRLGKLSYEDINEAAKATSDELHQLAVGWGSYDYTMHSSINDYRQFTRIPIGPSARVADCPPGRPASPCREPNGKEIGDFTAKWNQRKMQFDKDERAKTRSVMLRACNLEMEILTNRLEPWEAKDLQADKPTKNMCAQMLNVDYGAEDVYKASQYLTKLQKELDVTLRRVP